MPAPCRRWIARLALAAVLTAGLAAALPAAAGAAEGLRALDAAMGGETEAFALRTWQGRPAVSALTRHDTPGGAPTWAVQVVVLDGEGWRVAGRWELPPDTRIAEPIRLPGAVQGWLLLVGAQWRIALVEGERLATRPLCLCDTIYSHGGAPDPRKTRFVYDLDGDGVDEVVLPYSAYLEAYRITPLVLAPEPLWRIHWNPDATPLPREEPAERGFRLPDFTLADVDGDGRPELLVQAPDRLFVAAQPPLQVQGGFVLDGARRALLQRRTRATPLPDSLAEALRRTEGRRFAGADGLLNALAQWAPREAQVEWAPYLLAVLTATRSDLPVARPYAAPLSGLGTFRPEDRAVYLGLADMDGDGVLDVLHAKLLDFDSVLSQKNELRWYRGRLAEGRLAFAPPTAALKTDAGSFAKLVHPRTDDRPPLAMLVATTEVTLGNILKALASQEVTLQARVQAWTEPGQPPRPVAAQTLTYEELKAPGRRAMFLLADLNGDGWRDYVLNLKRGELSVYLSAGAPPTLARPTFVASGLPLPSKPERVLVADLDGDGREEIVLRFRSDKHGALGEQLRVLRYEGE